ASERTVAAPGRARTSRRRSSSSVPTTSSRRAGGPPGKRASTTEPRTATTVPRPAAAGAVASGGAGCGVASVTGVSQAALPEGSNSGAPESRVRDQAASTVDALCPAVPAVAPALGPGGHPLRAVATTVYLGVLTIWRWSMRHVYAPDPGRLAVAALALGVALTLGAACAQTAALAPPATPDLDIVAASVRYDAELDLLV